MSITISISTRKREWASSLFSLDTNHFPKLRELAWISNNTSSRSHPHVPAWRSKASDSKWCRKFSLSEYFLPLFCFRFVLFLAAHGICIVSLGDLFTTFRQSPLRSLLFRTSVEWVPVFLSGNLVPSIFEGKSPGDEVVPWEIQLVGSNLTPDPFVVVLGDCVQCTGSLPQCNLPGLFGFPKCTMSFEKCKFNKPRPFRPGILQLETDCY